MPLSLLGGEEFRRGLAGEALPIGPGRRVPDLACGLLSRFRSNLKTVASLNLDLFPLPCEVHSETVPWLCERETARSSGVAGLAQLLIDRVNEACVVKPLAYLATWVDVHPSCRSLNTSACYKGRLPVLLGMWHERVRPQRLIKCSRC